MDRHTTDFVTRHRENDYTQLSSYSPQDSPTQAPTRHQEESVHPRQQQRMGSIEGEPTSGGHSIADIIERRWNKGKQREPNKSLQPQRPQFLSRPSMEPEERRESFVQRIEAAGQNVLRRSSSSADALIDKLSDALNSWSTGYDDQASKQEEPKQEDQEPKPRKPMVDEQKQENRRSWPLSFFFSPDEKERRTSWSDRAYSFFFRNNNNNNSNDHEEWGTQPDVEVQGSDEAYDDVQGSFKIMRPIKNSGAAKKQTTKRPGIMESIKGTTSTKETSKDQTRRASYAAVAKRSMTDQALWFNADPESGRIKVPPLSMQPPLTSQTNSSMDTPKKTTSQLLYDTKPVSAPVNHNRYHVVHHKKHPEEDQEIPLREPRFDSDFENWMPQPEQNTPKIHRQWPDSYQIKDENH
ncbi:hypothetical protein BJV82DRAFT_673003 [Fennellomyces sp. T-0311]|nr:hypothetical protein BJV82DRAFT_673003 [Fennellomyces sp. T-0311]